MRSAGPFRLVGGTRTDRERVGAAVLAVPAVLAGAATGPPAEPRLLTIRVDRDPARWGAELDQTTGWTVAGTYVRDLALVCVNPQGAYLAWTCWHEIGHALDAALAGVPGDQKFSTGRGFGWWQDCIVANSWPTPYASTSPSENFAERLAELIAARTGNFVHPMSKGWQNRAARMCALLEGLTGPF